jgi:hypothetical protein
VVVAEVNKVVVVQADPVSEETAAKTVVVGQQQPTEVAAVAVLVASTAVAVVMVVLELLLLDTQFRDNRMQKYTKIYWHLNAISIR